MDNLETFTCSHKVAYPSRDGGGKYSIYITKEDGTDMTIYGEALGAKDGQREQSYKSLLNLHVKVKMVSGIKLLSQLN